MDKRVLGDAGFTLIELIVALAVLAAAMAIAVPSLRTANQRVRLGPLAAVISADLKRARADAVAGNLPVALAVDPALHGYRVATLVRRLPSAAVLSLTTRRDGQKPSPAGQVTFFPDGSSTGGRITIGDGGGDRRVLVIDWLTGSVHTIGTAP